MNTGWLKVWSAVEEKHLKHLKKRPSLSCTRINSHLVHCQKQTNYMQFQPIAWGMNIYDFLFQSGVIIKYVILKRALPSNQEPDYETLNPHILIRQWVGIFLKSHEIWNMIKEVQIKFQFIHTGDKTWFCGVVWSVPLNLFTDESGWREHLTWFL